MWEGDLELPSYVERKVALTDITDTDMQTRMKGVKKGRAPGIDEVRVEMVMTAGDSGISGTKRLLNTCMRQGKVPGVVDRANCPNMEEEGRMCKTQEGFTLLSHIMKLLEMILDGRTRKRVEQELDEKQQGFRKRRGTTGEMFALRQLVEKRLDMQGLNGSGICGPGEGL